MSYLVVLPVIDRELSEKCVSLLGCPPDRLLVVDNSREGFAADWDAIVVRPPLNLGVARSWNIGYDAVMGSGADYLVLLSAATHFRPGGFSQLVEAMDARLDVRGVNTTEGWHCLALGRPLLEACGRFDENFWPAYFDDLDYLWRMRCSGLWDPTRDVLPQMTLEADRWGDAHGMLRCGVQVNFGVLMAYYREKWGGNPHEEQYDKPFGDQPLGYWPPASVESLAASYGLPCAPFGPGPVHRLVGR